MSDLRYEPYDAWAFAWGGYRARPFITSINARTRREVINKVNELLAQPWRQTYRNGGRVIKCIVLQKEPS